MKFPASQPAPPAGFMVAAVNKRSFFFTRPVNDHPSWLKNVSHAATLTPEPISLYSDARAEVAQSVEQRPEKPRVGSSILPLGTTSKANPHQNHPHKSQSVSPAYGELPGIQLLRVSACDQDNGTRYFAPLHSLRHS
jgi:hypothetical protein